MLPSVRGSSSCAENQRVGVNFTGLLQESLKESFFVLVSDAETQSLAARQSAARARGCRKSGVTREVPVPEPLWSSDLGEFSPSGGPRFPWGAGGCPSDDCNIQIRDSRSPEEQWHAGWYKWPSGSQLSPPVPEYVSHSGEGDPSCSEIRGRKVMLVRRQDCCGVRKAMLQAGRGQVTYQHNGIFCGIFCYLNQHRLWAEVCLIQHLMWW